MHRIEKRIDLTGWQVLALTRDPVDRAIGEFAFQLAGHTRGKRFGELGAYRRKERTYGFEAHDPGTLDRIRFDWRPEIMWEIEPPPRILWLRRKNLVAQYASWVIAMKTGRWVDLGNQKAVPQTILALHPDPEKAADWIARRVETRLELQETLVDFDSIQVEYERLCEKPQVVCAEIFRFLGISPLRVNTRTIPLRNYRTTRVLGNYEEIVEALQVRLAPEVVRKWMCRGKDRQSWF